MDDVTVNIVEAPDIVNVTIVECAIVGTGTGDMAKAVYDPTNVADDAFDMENMVEGATKKILTVSERTKLTNTSGTNTGDQDISGLVPNSRDLTINGVTFDLSADRSWTVDALPTQTGNAGKYLKTDGTTATWQPAGGEDEDFTIIAAFKSFYNY